MTNEELLKTWHEGEARQKELWKEILQRGLYLQSMGIDPNKRDSSWRNPINTGTQTERNFYNGVKKAPMGVKRSGTKRDLKQEAKDALRDLL